MAVGPEFARRERRDLAQRLLDHLEGRCSHRLLGDRPRPGDGPDRAAEKHCQVSTMRTAERLARAVLDERT